MATRAIPPKVLLIFPTTRVEHVAKIQLPNAKSGKFACPYGHFTTFYILHLTSYIIHYTFFPSHPSQTSCHKMPPGIPRGPPSETQYATQSLHSMKIKISSVTTVFSLCSMKSTPLIPTLFNLLLQHTIVYSTLSVIFVQI